MILRPLAFRGRPRDRPLNPRSPHARVPPETDLKSSPELVPVAGHGVAGDGSARSALGLLAILLVVHVVAWAQHPFLFLYDLDSQHYARLAGEMLTGKFELASHTFNNRVGVTAPTALLYRALGIGPRTTTLWPLVASLLTIVAVFATAYRTFGRTAALLAALLLSTNIVQVEYAAHLLPDIVVSGFMLGSTALLYAGRDPRPGPSSRPWLMGSLIALTLLAALVTKETVVWIGPFFLGILILDLVRRKNLRLWLATVTTGLVCLGLFFLAYYLATGNALHALASVEGTHNVSVQASFVAKSEAKYLDRLTVGPARFFLQQLGYGYLFLLAVPALVHMVRPLRSLPPGLRYWASYATVVLLCFWFGSTSLRTFNPLPISPRFLMPLLAPLSLAGGVVLSGFLSDEERAPGTRLGLSLSATASLAAALAQLSSRSRSALYGALGLALAFLASPARDVLRGRASQLARLALVLVPTFGVLVYYGLRGGVKPHNPLRVLERDFIEEHVATLPAGSVVFTDGNSAFLLPLIFARESKGQVRVVDWSDAAAVRAEAGAPGYVLLNQTTLSMLNEWIGQAIPDFAFVQPPQWRSLASFETHWVGETNLFDGQRVLLFAIDDPAALLPH